MDFVVFRVFLGISRARDRAKYQKPWPTVPIIRDNIEGDYFSYVRGKVA